MVTIGLKVLSLFDGMAGGRIAFKELDIPVDKYIAYEIDKYAIKAATHNFPEIEEKGDVFDADFTKYKGVDFLVGGSPCFTEGHMVLTDKGYKDISEVEIGDMVLTHKNRYKPVTRLYERKAKTVRLKIKGYPELETTENHPFYTIIKQNNRYQEFTETPRWLRADEMTKGTFCGEHIHMPSNKNPYNLRRGECYAIGKTIAKGKKIPEFIYNMPYSFMEELIDGYIKVRGHYNKRKDKGWAVAFSKELAFGLQRLLTSCYRTNVNVSCLKNNVYLLTFKKNSINQETAHIQDNIMWTAFVSAKPTGKEKTVYNIEVKDDNSYTVNNCIVHNCTYWSIAQKNNRETEASGMGWELFCQYVRALKEVKPKYFIYENNKSMSKAIRDSIRETFGFEEICINSSLVSAQNRQRFYWAGIRNPDGTYRKAKIEQPEDRGILLKDIINDGFVDRDKSYCLKHQQGNARDYFKKRHTQIKFEPVGATVDGKSYCITAVEHKGTNDVYEVKDGQIKIKEVLYPIKLSDGYWIIRKLTVAECKKLQTIPDWYDMTCVSDTRGYQLLGNGWTIQVICHIISSMMKEDN